MEIRISFFFFEFLWVFMVVHEHGVYMYVHGAELQRLFEFSIERAMSRHASICS